MLGSGAVQGVLHDDLGGENFFCFKVGDFVALGEPSSSQGFSLGVLLDGDLPVGLGDFFLNDDLVGVTFLFGGLRFVHSN